MMRSLAIALTLSVSAGLAVAQSAPDAAWPTSRESPEAIKQTAKQILESREFATDLRAEALRQLYQRITQALQGLLERLAGFIGASSRAAAVIAIAMAALCVGLAAYVVWMVVRRSTYTQDAGDGSRSMPGDEVEAESIDTRAPSSAELRQMAEAHQRLGDRAGAVRYYFQAYLAFLHELGLVLLEPRWTNADYVRALGTASPHSPRLRDAIDRFERIWYGGEPGATRDVEALEALSRPTSRGVAA